MHSLIRLLILFLLTGNQLAAADRPDPVTPTGTWSHDSDGLELILDFPPKSKSLTLTILAGDNGLVVNCDYEWKKGAIHAKIRDITEKGSFPVKLERGTAFSFQFRITGKTATVSDYQGALADEARRFFEGEYTPVPPKQAKPE